MAIIRSIYNYNIILLCIYTVLLKKKRSALLECTGKGMVMVAVLLRYISSTTRVFNRYFNSHAGVTHRFFESMAARTKRYIHEKHHEGICKYTLCVLVLDPQNLHFLAPANTLCTTAATSM